MARPIRKQPEIAGYADERSHADVEKRFGNCPAVAQLAHQIDREIPPGREKSLALTNLELVMFWADAATARNA